MKFHIPSPRTVYGKFLLVYFPLAFSLSFILFTFFEWNAHQSSLKALRQKLDHTLNIQRTILAKPVADQDAKHVQAILTALSIDPEF